MFSKQIKVCLFDQFASLENQLNTFYHTYMKNREREWEEERKKDKGGDDDDAWDKVGDEDD